MQKFLYRCLFFMTTVILTGCQKENYPAECEIGEFVCESEDYRTYMDALGEYNGNIYRCYENTSFEMLKTTEKQALYKLLIQNYKEIMWEINGYNLYLAGSLGSNLAEAYYVPSRLKIQQIIDKHLRGTPIIADELLIPSPCWGLESVKDRNMCYKELLNDYTRDYIFKGYSPYFEKNINHQPKFRVALIKGIASAEEFFKKTSLSDAEYEQLMELYYLELFDVFEKILSIYEKCRPDEEIRAKYY